MSETAANDEFAAIAPAPERLRVGDETLTLTPLRVRVLPAVMAALAGVDTGLFDPDDELALAALMIDRGEQLIDLVALLAGREPGWVSDLETEEFFALLIAVLQINADFFRSGRRAQTAAPAAPAATWADTLQLLISSGHPPSAVQDYTLAQVRLFAQAARRQRTAALRDLLVITRAAQLEKRHFKEILQGLDCGD